LSPGFSHPTCAAAYARFTPSESGQRSPPTSYRGCWHVVSRGFFCGYRHRLAPASSPPKGVYDPKAFIPHAASLRQAFAHCARSPTAASRRSLGRVSVPVWLAALSRQLPVVALVGRYPTNELIGREPIPKRKPGLPPTTLCSADHAVRRGYPVLAPVSRGYPGLRGRLLTCYSPVRRSVPGWVAPPGPIARLACVRHAASVRPEPGSNSP
jgi:hypothetical protein